MRKPSTFQTERKTKMHCKNLLMGLAAVGAIALFAGTSAVAQITVRTWDGGASTTDWNTATNWSDDNVPNTVDEQAVIPNNGASSYTVDLNTNITVGSLVMYDKAILNIASTANATLTVDK